jgi:hypothetical protein
VNYSYIFPAKVPKMPNNLQGLPQPCKIKIVMQTGKIFDLNHMDSAKHARFTGVSNEKILDNLDVKIGG